MTGYVVAPGDDRGQLHNKGRSSKKISRKKAVLNRDVEVFGANFAAGSGWSLGPNGAAKLDPKSGDLQVTVGHGIVETIPADAFDVE